MSYLIFYIIASFITGACAGAAAVWLYCRRRDKTRHTDAQPRDIAAGIRNIIMFE